jgi:hypothetical protein
MTGRIWLAAAGLAGLLTQTAAAQDIPIDAFSGLASKATGHVEVNLDGSLLQLAAGFLSGKDPDEVKVKQLLSGLKGIYIRTYTFANPGEYSLSDADRVRNQLKGWSQVVSVHEAQENTGIYMKTEGGKIAGLVVVSAEPKELTLINISGSITPDQLKDLSGKFGIPDLGDLGQKAPESKAPGLKTRPKNKEE